MQYVYWVIAGRGVAQTKFAFLVTVVTEKSQQARGQHGSALVNGDWVVIAIEKAGHQVVTQ